MRIAEIKTWTDEDAGGVLQEIQPVSQGEPSVPILANPGATESPESEPKAPKRRFMGQGQAQGVFPEGSVTVTYRFGIEADTTEDAFAAFESADKKARDEAVAEFNKQRTKAVLSGRIALPLRRNRMTLPPGNGG